MPIVPQSPARRFSTNTRAEEQFECELPPDVRTELSELHSGQLPWPAKVRSRTSASCTHLWAAVIAALVLLWNTLRKIGRWALYENAVPQLAVTFKVVLGVAGASCSLGQVISSLQVGRGEVAVGRS
jgi:hypothetical protein